MRFLMLAAALAFTASPALGQFRQELPQWAEQGNASAQTRLGLMYDLDWDVPQNDTEGVRWKPILIGAGIGLTLGLTLGWMDDDPSAFPFMVDGMECIHFYSDPNGPCQPRDRDKSYQGRITGSLVGAGVGAALGWLLQFGEAAPD